MYRIGYYQHRFGSGHARCAYKEGLVFVSGQGGWRQNDSYIMFLPVEVTRDQAIQWACFGRP